MPGMFNFSGVRPLNVPFTDKTLAEHIDSARLGDRFDAHVMDQDAQVQRGMLADQAYRSQMNEGGMRSLRWLLHILQGGNPSRDITVEPPPPSEPLPSRLMPHAMTVRG